MIITCEECSTQFTLDDALVKPEGSKVRCGQCKLVFTAFPPDQELPEFEAVPGDMDEPDLASLDQQDTGDIPFDEPDAPEDEDLTFDSDDDLEFDTGDDLAFDDQDGDLEFDDQEMDFDGIEFDDSPDMPEAEGPDEQTAGLELEIEDAGEAGPDLDDDLDDDLEFDTGDDLIIEDTDLTLEAPEEKAAPELEAEQQEDPELEFDTPDLDFQEDDLTLDTQDDLELDDIQPIEDASVPAPDIDAGEEAADIEIRFDEDDNGMELEIMPVEPEEEDIPDDDLEEITFDVEDTDSDLELVFEEDADIVFEEPDQNLGAPVLESDEDGLTLETDEGFAPEPAEAPGLALEEEPAPALSQIDAPEEDPDAEKFSAYDQVLEQDTEPRVPGAETAPEPEEELPEMPYEPEPEIEEALPEETPSPEAAMIEPPTAADARRKRAKKSAVGAPVKILFLLFILVIAAYVASIKLGADIPFLSRVNIPYVTDILKPAPQPKAPMKPLPNEASINGRFVSNATAGELFIVTGRIENPSEITYSHIKVQGTLLTKDKAKAGTQTAYCGNIISEETLKTGNILDINQQMTVKQGRQNTNVNIKPGSSVMFMIVFSNLPENLTNFTVEVVDFKAENGR